MQVHGIYRCGIGNGYQRQFLQPICKYNISQFCIINEVHDLTQCNFGGLGVEKEAPNQTPESDIQRVDIDDFLNDILQTQQQCLLHN